MTETDTREAALRGLEDRMIDRALAREDVERITVDCAESLRAAGVAIDEVRVGARTLHPTVDAISVTWSSNQAPDLDVFLHEQTPREIWLSSPMYHMLTELVLRLHRPLHDPACPIDFPVLAEFRAGGYTDYLAHLVPIGDRSIPRPDGFVVRWMSRHPRGFSAADLAVLDRITPRLVAACEPGQERAIAHNLLSAYLGPHSGTAVLEGSVRPGDTQSLEAVILVADLAGFTAASDTMPGASLVEFLDRHFEAMVPPVEAAGGEILAFLGDGFLAVFDAQGGVTDACVRAAAAARSILSGIDTLCAGDPTALPVDIALHVGTVRYGNVGAGGRQAFTVIGPAVNLASRIEALCGQLGCRVLLSDSVAQHLDPAAVRDVGAHPVRGRVEPVPLFSLK